MNRVEQPLVSVVTPVYNGERYLAECIESVLAQTYERWEYLIVDNCSTDRTPYIIREYAENDDRIRLHTNEEFLEIIANWNHALRLISKDSKYCKVIHADDLLFPECLERMVEVAEANPSVGLVSSYRLFGRLVDLDGAVPYRVNLVGGRAICRSTMLGGAYVFGSPSSLLMRADLLRERAAFYNETNLHADTEACFDVLRESDLGFVHQVLTYTRVHAEAMTSRASGLNTFSSGWLTVLIKYGRVFLTRDEYARRLASKVLSYGVFLAKALVKLKVRDQRFREHHRATLAMLRRSVRAGDLARGVALGLRASVPRAVHLPARRALQKPNRSVLAAHATVPPSKPSEDS